MTVKYRRDIRFENKCLCVVDYDLLRKAMLWLSDKPQLEKKTIYLHGKYPAVSVLGEKIHVHRLLARYVVGVLKRSDVVHHKDSDKLNAALDNLEVISAQTHGHIHNAGKVLSEEHKQKIAIANRKRKGIKLKKTVKMPGLAKLVKLGWSINKISKKYHCDWSTVKNRIHENPELLAKEAQK